MDEPLKLSETEHRSNLRHGRMIFGGEVSSAITLRKPVVACRRQRPSGKRAHEQRRPGSHQRAAHRLLFQSWVSRKQGRRLAATATDAAVEKD